MAKKKIVILYSTAGMGHKKAAIAIYELFKKQDVAVENIDVMDYASNAYKFLYLDFYVFVMSRAKWLWWLIYYFSNIPFVDTITWHVRTWLDYKSLSKFGEMLSKKKPDAIIATHFLLPSIAHILKKKDGVKSKLFVVMTDYGPHSCWLSKDVDRYFVGSDSAADELAKRDIPKSMIDATGIPTTDEFCTDMDVNALRKKYGLDKNKKTIFMMSGGFGVGPIGEMLLSLNSCKTEIQVITVCGHNKTVYEKIQGIKDRLKYPAVLFGFTGKVAELMSVSDIMITKAGGISVTEAMNKSLPMILYGSVPGQEDWNEIFLAANNAAERAKKIEDIPSIADRMLLSVDAYESFKEGVNNIRKPNAAKDIVSIVMGEIE